MQVIDVVEDEEEEKVYVPVQESGPVHDLKVKLAMKYQYRIIMVF